MICPPCRDELPHDQCWGVTKDRTWCDCHRKEGIIHIDPQFCRHYKASANSCPSCGSTFDDAPDRDSGELPEHVGPTLSELEETFTDERGGKLEDNPITNPDDKQEGVVAGGKAKRGLIPRRNKETPTS